MMNEVWMTLGAVFAVGLLGQVKGSRHVEAPAGPGESRVIVTTSEGRNHAHNIAGGDVEAKSLIGRILFSELGGKPPNATTLDGWDILFIRPNGQWVAYVSDHPDFPGQMVWSEL